MGFHRTIAEISLGAISSNLNEVKSCIRYGMSKRKILAIVKASAYGHGTIPVAKRLISDGIDMLGVATVEEGIELRDAGIAHPIVVLLGICPDEINPLLEHGLTPTLYSLSLSKLLSDASLKKGTVTNVHIKIDTGMGRLGIMPEEATDIIKEIAGLRGLRLEGIMTHFADADLADKEYARFQLKRFNDVIEAIGKIGIKFPICHTANSAAILTFAPSFFDMVRPGIMLYGCFPSDEIDNTALRPALKLKTCILALKKVSAGTPISYGRTFITKSDSIIAVLPIGYANGYSRTLSNNSEVLIKGKRAPVAGRICMDMTMVDVTGIPGVRESDEVVLIGKQEEDIITADEIAKKIGSIPYEVLCSINSRVPRVYKE